MKNSLEIKDLSIGYKNKPVSHSINFKLNAGELCSIVGINGIGKSTLLRTLVGLQPKINGQILVEDSDLASISHQDLAKNISLVLTEPIASKNLTVLELIALGRQPHTNWLGRLSQTDRDQITKSIAVFKLESMQNRKCFELSDGQLQRVLIARSMAQDTPIIVLDEPTTHLDLSHKVEIFKLLQQLAHEHDKTILLTTHELDMAIQLSDKLLILDEKGNPFGSPQELIEKGCFETLFPKELVQFDAKTRTFQLKK